MLRFTGLDDLRNSAFYPRTSDELEASKRGLDANFETRIQQHERAPRAVIAAAETLIAFLRDATRTQDYDREALAVAALRYLFGESDAIPDTVEFGGYLDDSIILDAVVGLIAPAAHSQSGGDAPVVAPASNPAAGSPASMVGDPVAKSRPSPGEPQSPGAAKPVRAATNKSPAAGKSVRATKKPSASGKSSRAPGKKSTTAKSPKSGSTRKGTAGTAKSPVRKKKSAGRASGSRRPSGSAGSAAGSRSRPARPRSRSSAARSRRPGRGRKP